MKHCNKCGQKIEDHKKFCNHCGAKLFKIKSKKIINYHLIKILFISLIISSIVLGILLYQEKQYVGQLETKANNLETQIQGMHNQIFNLNNRISEQQQTINDQEYQIQEQLIQIRDLQVELGITQGELAEAKPYQERVETGQNLYQSYILLSDREDFAKPIILEYLGLPSPTPPINDEELWIRGKLIYNWISNHYGYCGDKGLRVENTFYEFQFYSADELLMSDNHRCGDCDDFAMLFASFMYASGVPEDKVWVTCGDVPGGAHCWNWLVLEDKTYRIDSVCSQKQELISLFGIQLGIKGAYYTNIKENIDCFSSYTPWMKMNPQGYHKIE